MAKGVLLRHRDFRLLWGGETVSEMGSQVSLLAIPLLAVRTLHATPFEMGLLTAASTAAFLVVGLPAGVWVDRMRRRRVMIGADLGRMLALGSVPVAYAVGGLTLAQLFVVTLASGILTVFFDVAYQSYLPALVGREHLVEGNAKLTGSAQVAAVAGPSVAGGLVQAIGSSAAVAVDSVSFLASAAAAAAIRTPEPKPVAPPEGHPKLLHHIAEGLRFVFGNALLRAIAAATATSNLFSGIAAAVEIVFLVREVHASPGVIGLLFTMGGVGGVLGALAAGPIARLRRGAGHHHRHRRRRRRAADPIHHARSGPPLLRRRYVLRLFLGRRLQRQPGELPSAPVPGPVARPHERHHALRRVGRPAHRRPDRGCAGFGGRPATDPVDRCRRPGRGRGLAAGVAHADIARLPRGPGVRRPPVK
jgi:MFS family permease